MKNPIYEREQTLWDCCVWRPLAADAEMARKWEEDELEYLRACAKGVRLAPDNLRPLTCIPSSREIVMPRITFARLIEQLDPHTWQELVFGCAVHDLCIKEWTDAVFGERGAIWENPIANWPDFNPNPIVDEMLRDSRGAIIWAHQIHALYSLFDSRVEKMLEFWKILNAKMSELSESMRESISSTDAI